MNIALFCRCLNDWYSYKLNSIYISNYGNEVILYLMLRYLIIDFWIVIWIHSTTGVHIDMNPDENLNCSESIGNLLRGSKDETFTKVSNFLLRSEPALGWNRSMIFKFQFPASYANDWSIFDHCLSAIDSIKSRLKCMKSHYL